MNLTAVATIGNFDGVHLGHQYVLRRLRVLAEERSLSRCIAITFPRHPRMLFDKSFRPQMLTTLDERCELLRANDVEPCVLDFDEALASLTAREFMEKVLLRQLNVKVLLLGYDNRFGRRNPSETFENYVEYGHELGIEVVRCDSFSMPDGVKVSSSHIRQLLREGNVGEAERCLGRPYSIEGTVEKGFREGRKLGFPTANIVADAFKLIPSCGVYATTLRVEGVAETLQGMTNIGHRPTYGQFDQTIETHIFDFSHDIYGSTLRIDFHRKLRDEQRFDSLEALREQLESDAKACREMLHQSQNVTF